MLKIRKKPFFQGLFICFCFLALFIPIVFTVFSSNVIKFYVKSIFGSSLKYESIKIDNGKVALKNVNISHENFIIQIEEAQLSFKFSFKNLDVKSDIVIDNPTIFLKGNPQKKSKISKK